MLQRKTLQQTADLESLRSSLQHYTPKAVEKLEELLKPFLPEAVPMPDMALVLQTLFNLLVDAGNHLVESGWQRYEEAVGDSNLREDREDSFSGLRPKLYRIRDLFRGALGLKGPRLVALDDGVETTYLALLHQVTYVHRRLSDPTLLEGQELWTPLEPLKLAELIEPEMKLLKTAIESLTAEQRATEEALLALREVQEKSQRCYAQGARLVEGFYRLVGMDEEANRIRLVRRRATTPPSDDEALPEVTAAGGAPAETAATDATVPEAPAPEAAIEAVPDSQEPTEA